MRLSTISIFCCLVMLLSCNNGGRGATNLDSSNGLHFDNTVPISNPALITFSLNGNPGIITGNNITVQMPYKAYLADLIATFTATGQVTVNGVSQISGQTVNNFTNPVVYTVVENNNTENYTVTVKMPYLAISGVAAWVNLSVDTQGNVVFDEASGSNDVIIYNINTHQATTYTNFPSSSFGASAIYLAYIPGSGDQIFLGENDFLGGNIYQLNTWSGDLTYTGSTTPGAIAFNGTTQYVNYDGQACWGGEPCVTISSKYSYGNNFIIDNNGEYWMSFHDGVSSGGLYLCPNGAGSNFNYPNCTVVDDEPNSYPSSLVTDGYNTYVLWNNYGTSGEDQITVKKYTPTGSGSPVIIYTTVGNTPTSMTAPNCRNNSAAPSYTPYTYGVMAIDNTTNLLYLGIPGSGRIQTITFNGVVTPVKLQLPNYATNDYLCQMTIDSASHLYMVENTGDLYIY